jgi:hypothetical protein
MDVCVLYSKDKWQKPGQSRHRSTDKGQRENEKNPAGRMYVCVKAKRQNAEKSRQKTSTYEA